MNPDIYSYVKEQENEYETQDIQIGENWFWNMRKHIQLLFHLKNGVFYTGENDWLRAFKNIMEPILNLAYWTEDLEVKDVVFYIESQTGKVLSFLVKKYHDEVYTREHDLDKLFDEITESDIDYGGALVQKGAERPEVIVLNSIAFCDQTDILGGAIGFKFNFSPDQLRAMSKRGWGKESNGATISIEDLIVLADDTREADGSISERDNNVTSKNIETYIVRGPLPEHYLKDNDNMEDVYSQLQVIAFYTKEGGKKEGVTLYRKKESEENLEFHTSKEVYNRALGRGIGETILPDQIWSNFLTIHKTNMLESASKVPLFTDDPAYHNRNKIQDMENLEITVIDSESKFGIKQVPTAAPANLQLLSGEINEWFAHAQLAGQANDPILGVEANSGTTFRGQERTVAQGRGSHDRRRGQRAKFIERLYRKFIIPDIAKEITSGKKFLATLTTEEMSWVADQLATKYAHDKIKDLILKDKMPTTEEQEVMMEVFKKDFVRGGNKRLIEILKDEFKGVEIKMGINIAGKQKNLADLSDKVLSIFQFAIANPQAFQVAMQNPALSKSFEKILEFSGLSIADFSTLAQSPVASPLQPQQEGGQTPELALNSTQNGEGA